MAATAVSNKLKRRRPANCFRKLLKHWQFYVLILLPLAYVIIFCYIPMGGVLMAFKQFSPSKGIYGSPWVGLMHFKQFLSSPSSLEIIRNTIFLGVYTLLAGFPLPILLAVAINEVKNKRFKKTVQMVTYAPYFISVVVLVGIIQQVTDPRMGVVNQIIMAFGGKAINFMGDPNLFSSLYVWTGIWQTAGYSAIIYIAALTSVNPEVQEAAIVDGASRLKRIWHVDLPAIRPQIIIILIFNIGSVLNIGFEKVYLMQNSLNMSRSEVIATFVCKVGLLNADYSFSTAVGLFNAAISLVLLVSTNYFAKKITETSLW